MNIYNKIEASKLRTSIFSATSKNSTIQVKAYLKENALIRLQQFDSSITDCNRLSAFNPDQAPVDQIVETYPGEFQIKTIA